MFTDFSAKLICLALTCLVFAGEVSAKMYKWTDEQGRVHFSDKAPMDQQAEDVSGTVKKINVSNPLSTSEQLLEQAEESDRIRQEEVESELKRLRELPSKNELCEQARHHLNLIQGRVIFLDEQGREQKVSEKERERRAANLQAEIQKHCR